MMGYRLRLNAQAKCPLFEKVVFSGEKWKIAGVQCEGLHGFKTYAPTIIRTKGFKGLRQHKRDYCDSIEGYHSCPYYQMYLKMMEKNGM